MVKNLPVIQETWVQFLGWEGPLEKGMTTHSSILVSSVTATPTHFPQVGYPRRKEGNDES